MATRKGCEMPFRDFLKEERAAKNSEVNLIEQEILGRMRAEGFKAKEIYDMPIRKLWDFFLQIMRKQFEESIVKAEELG